MKFLKKISKIFNFKKKEKRKNILFISKKNTYKSKRKKKFNFFKTKFNFRNVSISDFYNKQNNNYVYYFIVWIILTTLSIYAFFFSDYFNIKKILIFENKIIERNIINMDLAYKSINNYQYKSIFFVDKKKIEKSLKNYQNNIKKVDIRRLFPNTLKIMLTPEKPVFNTKIDSTDYIILKNWSLVPSNKIKKLPEIKIFAKWLWKNDEIIDYKKIFDKKEIFYLKYLYSNFSSNFIFNKIFEIRFFPLEREVHIVLDNKTILIFSLGKNLKQQIEKAIILKKEKQKIFDSSFYIDLRITKKIFFCNKKISWQCKKNLKNIYHLKDKDFIFNINKKAKKLIDKKNKQKKEK